MPKRTNEFQQLILLIQKQLAGDAVVTESKMLTDPLNGQPVEVDIVIDTVVNSIPLSIAIECNAEGRPASIEWVREMFGKHDSLGDNTLVLVSKKGFSKSAKTWAQNRGVVTLNLDEATDQDWTKYVEGLSSLKMATFQMSPVGNPRLTLQGQPPEGSHISGTSRVRVPKTGFDASFEALVMDGLRRPAATESFMRAWLCSPPAERLSEGRIAVTLTLNDFTEIQFDSGDWWRLHAIETDVWFRIVETPLSLMPASLGKQQIAFGKASNIFPSEARATQYVLLNMIGEPSPPCAHRRHARYGLPTR